ncbi:hypothetical protein RJ639_034836 [Escallonia herrerae]|uniref:Uncharacterized protein n=1 Tax=Escallonia herrerae TaxID=1293975 RepID=A0AA88WVQ7_9ASTE|nr:hypothetical protein RJ639_034836 [Escallonia herrerae]
MPGLVHLDLGSNQLNGTIPKFITEMKGLKYLNLEKNSFHGVMPFNGSFIKRLEVFKVGGNSDLCYNHSTISSKVKLGIAPCDKHGLPILPPPAKDSSGGGGGGGESSNDDYSVGEEQGQKSEHHHGPSKIVLGVAIGLSSIVFLIIFLVRGKVINYGKWANEQRKMMELVKVLYNLCKMSYSCECSSAVDMLGISLCEQLRVARHYLNPANIFLVLLVLKYGTLQDEGPDVVTESVGVKMSLKHTDE